MKIVISGGKTGGHLVPGITLYEESLRRNIRAFYIMSATDLKYPVSSRVKKQDRYLLELKDISRKLSWKSPLYVLKILISFFRIFGVVFRFRPDAVIITGGYISNPVALAAVLLRIPLFIAEQNSVAGVTNRFYAPFARKVFVNFPTTGKIPPEKAVLTGNPTLFRNTPVRSAARRFFRVEKYKKVIGISGGSQGSLKINNAIVKILDYCLKNGIGVIWSLGSVDYLRFETNGMLKELKKYPNVRFYRFISRMDLFLSCVDLVISRSGATSVSEYIQYGVPSLLIPILKSPDDHQRLNAQFLVRNSCGKIIPENQLDERTLIDGIRKILAGKAGYRKSLGILRRKYYLEPAEKRILDEIQKAMAF